MSLERWGRGLIWEQGAQGWEQAWAVGALGARSPCLPDLRLAPAALDLFARGKRTCGSGGQVSPGDPVALGRGKQNWLLELEKDLCGLGAWCCRSLTSSSSANEDLRDARGCRGCSSCNVAPFHHAQGKGEDTDIWRLSSWEGSPS